MRAGSHTSASIGIDGGGQDVGGGGYAAGLTSIVVDIVIEICAGEACSGSVGVAGSAGNAAINGRNDNIEKVPKLSGGVPVGVERSEVDGEVGRIMVQDKLKVLKAVDSVEAVGNVVGQCCVAEGLGAVVGGVAGVGQVQVLALVGVCEVQPNEIVVDGPYPNEGQTELYLHLVVVCSYWNQTVQVVIANQSPVKKESKIGIVVVLLDAGQVGIH